jgi:hypothetical protein
MIIFIGIEKMKIKKPVLLFSLILILSALTFYNCTTGVTDSPDHGIVRVMFSSDPADTVLIEKSDTFSVSTRYTAIFVLKVFQGRVYRDSDFAVLYPTIGSYRQEDEFVNIISVDSSGNYKNYKVFESYVPPGNYNSLEFGVTPASGIPLRIVANSGKTFENPVELPPGENLLVHFDQDFNVTEDKVTEIDAQISPFESVKRYRDVYRLYRVMKITDVHYY